MTKQEALIYLNVNEENWQEELENKLFELKKDLFRRVLIPKLLLKKAETIETWHQASLVLGAEEIETEHGTQTLPLIKDGNVASILALYRAFETDLIKLKLKLSKTLKAKEIATLLREISALEIQRQEHLKPLAIQLFSNQKNNFEVKISDDNHTGIIISELKQCKKNTINKKKNLFLLPYFEKDLQRILKSRN